MKGLPKLTSIDFCRWVNEILLPNSTLEPGFPRKIGLKTAHKWLHNLGFDVLTVKKQFLLMNTKCDDVFLCKMVKLGFLHFTNAPTEDAVYVSLT